MNKIDMRSISSKILLNKTIANTNTNTNTNIAGNKSFDEVLNQVGQAVNSLNFSKHAKSRMSTRNITLSTDEMIKIESAIDKASIKGINEALILMGNKAFIASVKTKTIITTVNAEQLKDSVFTNIDGAVII